MKQKLIYVLILVTLIAIGLFYQVRSLRSENAVYKANQAALLNDIEYYQTESGRNAASVQKLTLSYSELKEHYNAKAKLAEELGIKLKRIQSVSNNATKTKVEVRTEIRDSIIYRDSIIEKIRFFRWNDPWVSIFGEVKQDSVDVDFQSCDTLVQVVHRVPHKFWFFRWGTKAIKQEVVSTNPHTKITYTELIELK